MKKGERMSDEQRAKISAAHKGKVQGPPTAEHRARLSEALTGRTLDPEHRARIAAANTGVAWDAERRARASERMKASWEGSETQKAFAAYSSSPENLENLRRIHATWLRSPEGIAHSSSLYIGFTKFVEPLRARDGDLCQLCLEPIDFAVKRPDLLSRSVDHIVPSAAGGSDGLENLWLSHLLCNLKKGSRHIGRPDGTTDPRKVS